MVDKTILAINYIVQTPGVCGGAPRIDGTRITVDWIVGQMVYAGRSMEEMAEDYAHVPLTPSHLHAALAYYYDHQDEIDSLIADSEQMLEEAKQLQRTGGTEGYVTAKQAAEMLGVDHESHHIARLCREGILACRKIANRWMVSRASIEAYKRSNRKPGPRSGSETQR
jgi:uncharacterized protein (DUF433 family)